MSALKQKPTNEATNNEPNNVTIVDHNNKTLCEKIAEGFVISFLIALLVVPCDLFQPAMWAAPIATPSPKAYILDYPCTESSAEAYACDNAYDQSQKSESDEPTEPLSTEEPTGTEEPQTTTDKPTDSDKTSDKTIIDLLNLLERTNNPTPADTDSVTETNTATVTETNTVPSTPTDTIPCTATDTIKTNTEGYILNQDPLKNLPKEFPVNADQVKPNSAIEESMFSVSGDSLKIVPIDTIPILQSAEVKFALDSLKAVTNDSISKAFIADSLSKLDPLKRFNVWVPREVDFNPDPTRAVWLSALFPGLGQIYNRRYWKLPIVVGAYMGLAYATSWNNTMLGDYTRAYRDIMDNDPSTNSYMDFFPPTVDESTLDKRWLQNLLYSRKNYFRRYRDLCIILMVGVYFLAMVDAYVDASLAHFDISQDLSLDWSPAVFHDGYTKWPSVGVSWAFNF